MGNSKYCDHNDSRWCISACIVITLFSLAFCSFWFLFFVVLTDDFTLCYTTAYRTVKNRDVGLRGSFHWFIQQWTDVPRWNITGFRRPELTSVALDPPTFQTDRNIFWQLSRDGNSHGSGMPCTTTASPKPPLGATWRVGDTADGRRNAGWTMSKSARPCPCRNCPRWPPIEKRKKKEKKKETNWKRISAESFLMSLQRVKGLNWTELNWLNSLLLVTSTTRTLYWTFNIK